MKKYLLRTSMALALTLGALSPEAKAATFEDLPDEIVGQIMRFGAGKPINPWSAEFKGVQNLGATSRQLYKIFMDPETFKDAEIRLTWNFLVNKIKYLPSLQARGFKFNVSLNVFQAPALSALVSVPLNRVSVVACNYQTMLNIETPLSAILRNSPNLKTFSWINSPCGKEFVYNRLRELPACLEELDLKNNVHIFTKGDETVFSIIAERCPNLKSLNLEKMDTPQPEYLARFFPRLSQLQTLILDQNNFRTEQAITLGNALSLLPELRLVSLKLCQIPPEGLEAMQQLLPSVTLVTQ